MRPKIISVIVIVFCCSLYGKLVGASPLVSQKNNEHPVLRFDPSGSSAWYPYYINDPAKPGILPEVLDAILTVAKIKGVKRTFPPKRTIFALNNGDIDFDLVNLEWLSKAESREGFVFSEGIIRIKEYVVTLNDYQTPEFVPSRQAIGTVRGYYYHNDTEFDRVDFSSERELVLALQLKRVAQIICGDRPAIYWSQQLNIPVKFTELHSDGYLRIRLRKELHHLLPQLNEAIITLNKKGVIDDIVNRYIDSSATPVSVL